MLNMNNIDTEVIGVSEFKDSKSYTHKVKHCVILSDSKKCETEERIADEMYRIFTGDKKLCV